MFDSNNYDGDAEKALNRAKAEFAAVQQQIYIRDDRQIQTVLLLTARGDVIKRNVRGDFPDGPEPEDENN